MKKPWKKISSTWGDDFRIFKVRRDLIINPRNDVPFEATILDAHDAANVLATTPDNKVLFIKQFRFGTNTFEWELPGGFAEPNENLLIAAQRELAEETGFSSKEWSVLGKVPSNPAFMNNYIHHFRATNITASKEQEQDEAEDIETAFFDWHEVWQMLRAGQIAHPHTLSALLFAIKNEH